MNQQQVTEVSLAITVGMEMSPEQAATLTEAERLGVIVAGLYSQALQARDAAERRAEDLRETLEGVVAAAENVLALDILNSMTWAKDEDLVEMLKAVVQHAGALAAVDSAQENETTTQETP